MVNATAIGLMLFCFTIAQSLGQLYTDDVSDGPCTNIPVAKNFTACLPLFVQPTVYTVNIASQALYRNYAESFLGRPAKDQAELDSICYSFLFAEAVAIQTGFSDKYNIRTVIPTEVDPISSPTSLGLGKFRIETTLAQSPGSYVTNQYVTIDQVIWCDLKHVLYVRCVNDTRQDWKVGSVGDPEPWMLPLAKNIVSELGMPPENALHYKSVSNGGTCPDAENIETYVAKAEKNLGHALPSSS